MSLTAEWPLVAPIAYRLAAAEDVPALVELIRAFIAETYRAFVGENPTALAAFLTDLLANPLAAVFVAERHGALIGAIGVLAYMHPMSGERCAGELFWKLHPEHRGAGGWLLRRAESWARAQGCRRMQMIQPFGNDRVGAMYQALGYEPVELMYARVL